MRKFVAIAAFTGAFVVAGAAIGAADLGKAREADMKAVAGSAKTGFMLASGKTPWDAAAAKAAMQKIAAAATDFPTRFPDGSQSTDKIASPEIWKNKADFEARAAKLATDAKAAADAAANGEDAFKVAFAAVGDNCKGCHQLYRMSD